MPTRKSKKSKRKRGTTTHGYGSKKKHRGAGSRGGRGNAGKGKRGEQRKPSFWKKLGSHGFKRNVKRPEINTINIIELERNIDTYIEQGKAEKSKNTYVVDLGDLGYQKLLGKGNATKKMKISAKAASKKAVEKIEEAGGEFLEA